MATPGESILAAACALAGVPLALMLNYIDKTHAGIARKLRRGSAGHLT